MKPSRMAALFLLCGFMACTDEARPQLPVQGLGRPCPSEGCITEHVCVSAAGPSGETRTCEIRCDADSDCPRQFVCNLPPITPDSLANVCVDE
jgi:hypothetical protein